MKMFKSYNNSWGFLFQKEGLWVGAHYSNEKRRWCINFIPCCTLWILMSGGIPPKRTTI